ncbi:MAG: endonuclease domain-containing protein [Gemmatimonadetes bacterium]|nr:endonuclease domain-containing protein [Gemmatimonadota bacterium]
MNERKQVRGVSSDLRRTARELRRSATTAEAVMWEALRAGRLDGLKFRRQHTVGRFVLDFYCPEFKLVVEVDGDIHEQQPECDAARSAELIAYGCRILRFRNEEVLNALPAVLDRIRTAALNQSPLSQNWERGLGGEGLIGRRMESQP